jgi:serine/threonine protein kinase
MHAQRILHRDLKPSNVLVCDGGKRVLIGDLGFGRLLGTGEHCARTNVGTPLYLSPELCEERPYDEKSDIWALGCLVYEMIVGHPPFLAANQVALAGARVLTKLYIKKTPLTYSTPEKIVKCEPASLPPACSIELQFLVSRLLEKRAAERPTAAQSLSYPAVDVRRENMALAAADSALRAEVTALEQLARRQQVSVFHYCVFFILAEAAFCRRSWLRCAVGLLKRKMTTR